MREQNPDDDRLEAFFEAARKRAPEASDALMARVAADAVREMPRARPAGPSLRSRFLDVIGGWQGIGGLMTATAAGLWIGYAGLADPAGLVTDTWSDAAERVELMPGAEVFAMAATEGN
ncbi:hypothetical protein DEA8626_00698 [Defluviimonas aquaemixtae]|uniref:Dihydroorotate dehydrogenase n=1 Tax=Albidovulum aquaemixtae TaxID=1542388 RepID=A0A2R8B3M4_9RHOB|nr:hypothetical protein [Defluviimonas aquaemixtae]SPH17182.1 hypothetical protein DEA8626_00698 [Defluviimonas aquaemixtae]